LNLVQHAESLLNLMYRKLFFYDSIISIAVQITYYVKCVKFI